MTVRALPRHLVQAAGQRSMERLLTWIAAVVAACVTLLLPGVAFLVSDSSEHSILSAETEINARLVTGLITANPELWEAESVRLEELLRRRSSDPTPELRSVFGAQGSLVAEAGDALDWPQHGQSMPVFDAGRPVGQLRIQRSLRPLLVHAAWMGLLGLLLGTATFVALRTLPLRALRVSNDRLRHEATHDALTGLPNRSLFVDRLDQAVQRAGRSRRPLALLFIDLDRFKNINDSLGHQAGDDALRHAARRISNCLEEGWSDGRRSADGAYTLARMGGDEFTVLLESVGSVADTSALVERLQASLALPVPVGGGQAQLECSVGIALYPQDGTAPEELLRHADMAMYRAKESGRDAYHFFSQDLNRQTQERIALDQALRGALERGEFVLHFQPKAALGSGEVTGVEALLRWQRPGLGLTPPDKFIALLESSRLIVPVGAWVIEQACAQLTAWDQQGLPGLSMAVNVSPRQFRDPDLADHIERVLQSTGLAAHRLELEMTEGLLMEDNAFSMEVLQRIERTGVRLAIDDFGTGYSSLAYLKRFHVHTLKLDRSFVRGLPQDRESAAIAGAVRALATSLGLSVVCEGVESEAQRDTLRDLGCDQMQGYLLARPMPGPELLAWHQARQGGPSARHTRGTPSDGATRAPIALASRRG